MAYGAPGSRAADMAAQLAAKGLMWDGTQIVPIPQQPPDEPTYYQESSYGYAAPPSLGSLEGDAGWQGLMAELDRQGGMYDAEATRQKSLATSERDRLLSDLAQRGDLERENVAGSMETRGLLRSGETERNLARQRANELSRSTSITSGAATRIGDIEAQLAMQQSELARKRAEARADFLSRGYVA